MSDWRDQALILTLAPHGEHSALLEVFSREQGRFNGILRGGMGRRLHPVIQPANLIQAQWRSRIDDQLGSFTVEPIRSRALAMTQRLSLAGLGAVCAMIHALLPERAPHAALYDASNDLLDHLMADDFATLYLRWELFLLQELGFGLDLSSCAVTGQSDDLAYVSPKTGRAVSRAAAGQWAARLFPLPQNLTQGALSKEALLQGFALTSHFLARDCLELSGRKSLPDARQRLIDLIARS